MKATIKLFTLAIATILTTSSFAAGFNFEEAYANTNESDFGWYEISESAKATHEANLESAVFEISYDMLEIPVTVTIIEDTDSKHFIAKSEGFEARYTFADGKFGIDRLVTDVSEMSRKERRALKNNDTYRKQRIITQGENENNYFVGLIAGFLPEVVIN